MTRRSVWRTSPGLQETLDQVVRETDRAARVREDPVSVVREEEGVEGKELAGLLASCMALGGAGVARDKSREVVRRLGVPLGEALDRPWEESARRLEGWKHRFYGAEEVARLLTGARRVQRRGGGLGRVLGAHLEREGSLEGGMKRWIEEIQEAGWTGEGPGRAARHLLPVPGEGNSASKRLMLYLRWMVRPDDGVDLGLWTRWIDPSKLVMPVDVHIARLGRNLGLTEQTGATWRAAREITAELARFNPRDPVFYDFALCHLGMVQGCPSRRDEVRCEGCGVKPVCRHWSRSASCRGAKGLKGR
ncbi:MAG: DUF2400 domain-containing protein [Polyangiaceae bacterium]|nr:DUF2400 domain-containing protein [Polyangiaceae bacterium]